MRPPIASPDDFSSPPEKSFSPFEGRSIRVSYRSTFWPLVRTNFKVCFCIPVALIFGIFIAADVALDYAASAIAIVPAFLLALLVFLGFCNLICLPIHWIFLKFRREATTYLREDGVHDIGKILSIHLK